MFQCNCCKENNSNVSEKYNFNKGDYNACNDLLGAVDRNIRMDGLGISESRTGLAEVIVDAIRTFIPVSKIEVIQVSCILPYHMSVRMLLERSTGNGKDINIVKMLVIIVNTNKQGTV